MADEILIVDDDEDGRDALEAILSEAGYATRAVSSGEECLAAVDRAVPDLVLLDVQLPGLDGIDTLHRLRVRGHRTLPVILLTGQRLDPESIGSGLTVGAAEYLIKPVRPRELMARVAALVELARARRRREAVQLERMAMLVHDLRQPLAVAELHAEYLADEADDEAARRSGASIRSACRQMAELVKAVLAVAKGGPDVPVLDRRRLIVESVVREVVAQLRPLAEPLGINLVVDAPGETTVDADELKLMQVLQNLIGNALKFTPRGGQIDVGCHDRGGTVEVSVADSGPGLSPDEAERVFERWSQTRAGQKAGGSGLGLAIAREIVELHGGRIGCAARPGAGARFAFHLPTVREPAALAF